MSKQDLLKDSYKLYEQVKMRRIPTTGYKEGYINKDVEEDALVLTSIVPVKNANGQVIGAVLAAEILNRNYKYVDKVKKGEDGIAATIFKDDLRITTSVPGKDNGRATGTLVSAKVVDKVLIEGSDYVGKAMVAGIPMWSYYVPIKNLEGKKIGILFVAMTENKVMDIIKDKFTVGIFVIIVIALAVFVPLAVLFANSISNPIQKVVELAKSIEQGYLNRKIEKSNRKDEIGALENAFDSMQNTLRQLVKNIVQSAEIINTSTNEVSIAAEQTAQGADQVSRSIVQLASGSQEQANVVGGNDNINDMNNAIKRISNNSVKTSELSINAQTSAENSYKQATDAIKKINQIKNSANKVSSMINDLGNLNSEIGQIVDLIKGIANQTNLLALNAAIEAARAGEHGKGFAVVADEVKKLAGQSAEATDKITDMIKEIQDKTKLAVVTMDSSALEVQEGVEIVESTGSAIQEILSAIQTTVKHMEQISKDVESLANNSENVVKMMGNISNISEKQTASAQEISANCSALLQIAEELKKQTEFFKI